MKNWNAHWFKARRLKKDETEYINLFGDRTDKFGWVWWASIPELQHYTQDYGYYYAQRARLLWLFFGFEIEKRVYRRESDLLNMMGAVYFNRGHGFTDAEIDHARAAVDRMRGNRTQINMEE